MALIGDICPRGTCIDPDVLGSVVYARFQDEPDLLSIAVVDVDDRPVGLVERNAFFLKMAAEYGRALFARRPVSFVMDAQPLTVEADTPVAAFTGEALALGPSHLFKGFICVRAGRYHGVGSVLSLLQHASDESERRLRDLQRTEAFLDTVVDSVPSMLLVKDRAGRYVLVNRAVERLLGRSRAAILGHSDAELFPADEAAAFHDSDRRVWATGEPSRLIEQSVKIGSETRCVQTHKQLLPEADGEPGRLLIVSEDITEQKEAAAALSAALDASRAAEKAKSAFLANMSHEIRTPLNGVLGLASVLADADLPPRHKAAAATIAASAGTLERLLSDVLDLARIESGQLEMRPEPVDIETVAGRCSDLFAARAAEKGLRFSVSVSPDASGVHEVDPVRLEQVLNNLLGNAVKFTAEGSVSLVVDFQPGKDGRPEHVFAVCDTGIGFDAGAHAAVFGRFTQADASITRRFGGSGLGLAIARDLADRMGGALEAESTPGHGSTFRLRLPLRAVQAEATAQPASTSDTFGLRVLVADDHPVNLEVVRLILDSADIEAVLVADGFQALEAFRAERFDAALIDLQMPVMDGLTALREMRAVEAARGGPRTPLFALTANALPEHRAASMAAGADHHLAKPIVASRLLAALSAAIDDPDGDVAAQAA